MQLLEQHGIIRYRFWQDTGLSRATAYRFCDDSSYIPTGDVIEKICWAYGWQPGDFIYEPDECLSEGRSRSIGRANCTFTHQVPAKLRFSKNWGKFGVKNQGKR